MIRVELGEGIKRRGVFRYAVPSLRICGQSRLDASREIKRMGGDTAELAGLFRPGRSAPDLTCRVRVSAGLMVEESPSPHFAKFRPMLAEIRTPEPAHG
jgi:hypothetical protein